MSKYSTSRHPKVEKKEKFNCVLETILGYISWTVGYSEGVIIGWIGGCYEMGLRYDFSDLN